MTLGSPTEVTPDWLAARIDGSKASDVSRGVAKLINTGVISPGTQLPTIRALADVLDAKVATVTDAWSILRNEGLIETRRRGGTRVIGPGDSGDTATPRFAGWSSIELVNAWPDATLLPDIVPALVGAVEPVRGFDRPGNLTEALATALPKTWPFAAEEFTVLAGGRAAIQLVLDATFVDRDRVIAIESPGLLRTAQVLQHLDTRVISVDSDAEGPLPDSLDRALQSGVSLFFLQPSASIPTGSTLTPQRRDALAEVLRAHPDVLVLEEDIAGPLFAGISLGSELPERTIRLTQYWRAFGPDIDLVTVGGPDALLSRIRAIQQTSGQRASTLLQKVLATLLTDDAVHQTVATAAATYRRRNAAFTAALQERGVNVDSFGGLFVWIPVADEPRAVVALGSRGIRVIPGSDSYVDRPEQGYLRIATTCLPDDPAQIGELAEWVASAGLAGSFVETE